MQITLNEILSWTTNWGLKISTTKSCGVIFTNRVQVEIKKPLQLGTTVLTMEKSVKFLGMFFDSKLSWTEHCKYVVTKCKKRLNLMRSLTGTTWGASKTCLLTVYRTLIRSVLDYGGMVLESANHSAKAMLDSVQQQALRICCGAMTGTALSALQNECGEMPLELRRMKQQLQYFVKVKSIPGHPTAGIFEDHWTNHYSKIKKQSVSIYCTVTKFCSTNIMNIEQVKYRETPPWFSTSFSVDIFLSNLLKKSDPVIIQKALALEKISQYTDSLAIYTDGSKDQSGKVAAAYCVPELNITCKRRLPDNMSIYTAELIAIKLAIEWIIAEEGVSLKEDSRQVAIFSDSLSSLQSLQSRKSKTRPNLLNEICKLVTYKHIDIVWIPGHADIRGNELADRNAKEAVCRPVVDLPVCCEASEAHDSIDRYILQQWQQKWQSSSTGQFNKTVDPLVSCKIKYVDNCRARERLITRLRLGKCCLNHYLFKINCHPTGLCSTCMVPETIEHFLFYCTNSNLCRVLRSECTKLTVGMDLRSVLSCRHLTNIVYTNISRNI